jgi:beta-barrel assembly-enhancing protease
MRVSSPSRALLLALSLTVIAGSALAQNTTKSALSDKENPEMIGKRDINKHQLNFYSIDKEVALGRRLAAEIDRSTKFVEDPIIAEYINKVGQNLVLHSDAKVPFTIKVMDADEVNAFALPGGFFYVNKGLILAADNEAELAGPMAHEIAHVAARHGTEQDSKGTLVNYGLIPLYIFGGGWTGYAIQQGLGLAIPLGFLKFSRGAEEEADMLAVQYLWASGYDPNMMATFFEKLQGKEKKKPGTIAKIFSTHPVVGDRIDKVKALMARFPERSEYTINTSEFNQVKGRLITLTNARSVTARGGGASAERDQQRPTLKRRQPAPPEGAATPDAGTTGTTGGEEQKSERPTLRRRGDGEGESKPPTQ